MWEAFAVQKLLSFFQQKSISVFGYKVVKHLTSWPLNELVKLTMLWATGPWKEVYANNESNVRKTIPAVLDIVSAPALMHT